ncbi:MAG: hypothetical protein MJ180_01750 [Candidatus Gastranaerophilales bacterium]|nr:hypothetical protein [Candidatus Gastranaerophilales bacterium]
MSNLTSTNYFDLLNGKNLPANIQNTETQVIPQQVQPKAVAKITPAKDKVIISKNPDRVVNATGVVAGVGGLMGGATLGGIVGTFKLPGELVKGGIKNVKNTIDDFGQAIKNSPQMTNIANTIRNAKNPAAAQEEILTVIKTLSDRLNETFKNNAAAKSVIDKIVDPVINSVTVKNNIRSYGSGLSGMCKSPKGQIILKLLGFNKKTSKIVGDVTGNLAEGITQSVVNIRSFNTAEKAAWGEVLSQIRQEFASNPKIKVSKAVADLFKDARWITEPFAALQTGLTKITKGIGLAPLKSIGKWAAIGGGACTIISLVVWGGLKKFLMKNETTNS